MEAEDAVFDGEELQLNEAGEAMEAEAVEEVEFELGEANGEAEGTIIEENPVSPEQTLRELIDMAMEETKDEGIYRALNSAFATLADNAEALANPETGVIEIGGNAIVNVTFDALQARFDESPEQLMGAIGAAAMRADEEGYLQVLGGDLGLVTMAACNANADSFTKEGIKESKNLINGFLDFLGKSDKTLCLTMFSPALKGIIDLVFSPVSTSPNLDREILNKLNDIEKQLADMEKNLGNHFEDMVSLNSIGGEFQTLVNAIGPLKSRIVDITGNTNLNESEKTERLAALYDTQPYNDIVSAISGATNAYAGKTTFLLQERSIFGAAYRRACREVMFSGEAIDMVAPYLMRLLGYYLRAYSLVNQVVTAREDVYGANSCTGTREQMFKDLGGLVNGKADAAAPGVMGLYAKFFDTDRYVFINKNNEGNGIRLKKVLFARSSVTNTFLKLTKTGNCESCKMLDVQELKNAPLTADQLKSIIDYCNKKRISVLDLLLNRVGFIPTQGWEDGMARIEEQLKDIKDPSSKEALRIKAMQDLKRTLSSDFYYNASTHQWSVSRNYIMPKDKNALYRKASTYHETTYLDALSVNAAGNKVEAVQIEHDLKLFWTSTGVMILQRR